MEMQAVRRLVQNPNSFGGVTTRDRDGRGAVPAAIAETVKEIGKGANYYIRSDIASFFTKIPKPIVLDTIGEHITDSESRNFIQDAIYIELENMAKLRRQGFDALFPIQDIGVAQGNCLSPLLGNILLSEFDALMNDSVCRCLRYIDDFIIRGPNKQIVRKRFREAVQYLKKYDMTAYDPAVDTGKADHGDIASGFDFLGVNLMNGLVRPAKKSRQRVIKRTGEVFRESAEAMAKSNGHRISSKHSLIRTLVTVSGIAKGWSEQYSYCNERNVLQTLDREIDKQLREFIGRYSAIRYSLSNDDDKRRLLGVALLADSEGPKIEWGVSLPNSDVPLADVASASVDPEAAAAEIEVLSSAA